MQIIQSLNDTMNIIFSPSTEGFSLLDFVLVEEDDKKFLGQVIEVKNDKYELDKNVAVLKILYSINAFDEIVEYNGYTPSRDAHVELYNQKEIETFLNENTTKFIAGLNPKTMLPLDFNIEFFKNAPVILADKLSELYTFYMNISEKLSEFENVVIFDYTGNLFVENSLRLRAGVDFKLPLNYDTLSYIWEIALANSSIETQAVCEDIFNEVKLYIKSAHCDFIPFDNFVSVIENQYKKTPIKELLVLKNRLNRYQQSKIFAQTKEELEIMPKITDREKITVLDFSFVDSVWHRAFSDYIFSTLDNNSFVLLRLNENNCDQALIEKIFAKTKKLNIIPSFSYGFKKLTNVIEYANNFVFMPTLNYSHNFGYVNNTISMLTKNYVAFFGENTKCLIFKIQNLPVVINRYEPEEKKKVKKIKLKSLSKYSNDTKEEDISEYHFANDDEIANEILEKDDEKLLQVIETKNENKEVNNDKETVQEEEKEVEIPTVENEENSEVSEINFEEISKTGFETVSETNFEEITETNLEEIFSEDASADSSILNDFNDIIENDESKTQEIEDIISEEELDLFDNLIDEEDKEAELEKQDFVEIDYSENEKIINEEVSLQQENIEEPQENNTVEPQESVTVEPQKDVQEEILEIKDDIEAQETLNLLDDTQDILISNDTQEEELVFDEDEPPVKPQVQEVIPDISKPSNNAKITVGENITIDLTKLDNQLNKIDETNKKEEQKDLPVFETEETSQNTNKFKVNDLVQHEKYGIGRVVKIINYASRCLLQVEFEDIGKRLLDPKIANLIPVKNA